MPPLTQKVVMNAEYTIEPQADSVYDTAWYTAQAFFKGI